MAKNWYPVINYEKCKECGICVDMCAHEVYNKSKTPHPVVVNPDGCVEGCKGCGKRCENKAIDYFDSRRKGIKPACNCG